MRKCVQPSLRGAKRRSNPALSLRLLDCFASLAMTFHPRRPGLRAETPGVSALALIATPCVLVSALRWTPFLTTKAWGYYGSRRKAGTTAVGGASSSMSLRGVGGYDGGGRAGNPQSVQERCSKATPPPAPIPSMPEKAQPASMPWKRSKGLPPRHDCCVAATLGEDLTLITGSSCPRRFLATPLHEIIFRRTNRPPTRGSVGKSAGETGSRWTPRPTSRGSCRAVT
jgi:hypothetical protein